MKTIISLIIFLFLTIPAIAQDEIHYERLSVSHGISQTNVRAISQDYIGFLWVGTDYGLNRFDGITFKNYFFDSNDTTTISDNQIRVIFEDDKNNLWIGTGNGLNLYNRDLDIFERIPIFAENSLVDDPGKIMQIYQDSQKRIWITTTKRLYLFNEFKGSFKEYSPYKSELNNEKNSITYIVEDLNGNFWCASKGPVLFKFNPATNTFSEIKINSPIKTFVWKIHVDNKNHLWIGTDGGGLYRYNPQSKNIDNYSISSSDMILDIFEIDNFLWLGVLGKGVLLFDKQTGKTRNLFNYDRENIGKANAYCFFKDKKNIFWVGTSSGLLVITPKKFQKTTHFFENNKLYPLGRINNFLETKDGKIWISYYNGHIAIFDPKTNSTKKFRINGKEFFIEEKILKIIEDKDSDIWFLTYTNGIYLYRKKYNRIDHFEHIPGNKLSISSKELRDILEDSRGQIWIATLSAGIDIFDKDKGMIKNFKYNPNIEGTLNTNIIYSIFESTDKTMYFATSDGGLNVFDRELEKFHSLKYSEKDTNTLSSNKLRQIIEDNYGNLWISTFDKGINKYNPNNKKVTRYNKSNYLPSDQIKSMCIDHRDVLWISTDAELVSLNLNNFNSKFYYYKDGIPSGFTPMTSLLDKNKNVYFGGGDGYIIFHPDSLKHNADPPRIAFTNLKVYNHSISATELYEDRKILNKSITEAKKIILSHEDEVFTISFAALDYLNPIQNRYQFMLEGFERKWNYSADNFVTYRKVPPGEYRFIVKASNNDGLWNEEGSSIIITIYPPYWETAWFKVLILFSILFIIYMVYKIRTKQILKHLSELNEEILERKKVEEKLKQTSNKLRRSLLFQKALMEALPIPVYYKDRNGKYIGCNNTFAEFIGRESHDIINKTNHDIWPLFIADKYKVIEAELLKSDKLTINEEIIKNSNLEDRNIILAQNIFKDENGITQGIVGTFIDITELKNVNKQLNIYNRELEQIIYIFSHDFKSPLVNINGYTSELEKSLTTISDLLDEQDLPKLLNDKFSQIFSNEIHFSMGTIKFNVKKLEQLLKGLLKISQLRRSEIKNEPLDMETIINNNLKRFEKIITKKNIEFKLDKLYNITGDEKQISEAFFHLIDNSIKFSKQNGSIRISSNLTNNKISYLIEDNGIGIAKEHLGKIFEIYHQLDPQNTVGDGIGLTIVSKILENHDAEIKIESKPEIGTKVIITFKK